jgi:hypothetical protein
MMRRGQTAIFMDHIRENAPRYFEGFESTQIKVQFEEKQERPRSILYQFTVSDKEQNRGVFVKVPLYHGQPAGEANEVSYHKPNLFPKTELKDSHKLGYSALNTIYDYFSSLGEKQLGTIRVLDYLPEHRAIFTEASRDPNLRQLLLDTGRPRAWFASRELELPLRNIGRWLRLYHEMSKEDDVEIRHAHRHEYIEAVATLADFLSTALGDKVFFQKIASALELSAFKILPDSLPLGLGHGDFAMRNILVGSDARITVIDTFAKWRTPIYEDIGYFLHGLKLSAPQVISQGLLFGSAQISTYERAFLDGYFDGTPVPYPEIRLYEMLSLLDKWSSIVTHSHRRGRKFKKFGALKVALTNRYFKKSAKWLLREIAESRSI